MQRKVLIIDCADASGLITKITGVCFANGLNIIKNSEFVDNAQGRFFMRTELEGERFSASLANDIQATLPERSRIRLVDSGKKRVVIMVTKEAHCLGDILIKSYSGALDIEIAAVIGNHQVLQPLVDKFDIPFYYVSHQDLNRSEHESKILEIIAQHAPDYIVLAKFMRVLTPEFVSQYPSQIINIHHSFLPAFVGASPYKQAWERGVKIIGATAHFVTDSLDEGPIIKQDVIPVDHSYSAEDLARCGRDVEKSVLSKALQLVINEDVIVYGNKTVVF